MVLFKKYDEWQSKHTQWTHQIRLKTPLVLKRLYQWQTGFSISPSSLYSSLSHHTAHTHTHTQRRDGLGRRSVALTGTRRLASVECREICQSQTDLHARGSESSEARLPHASQGETVPSSSDISWIGLYVLFTHFVFLLLSSKKFDLFLQVNFFLFVFFFLQNFCVVEQCREFHLIHSPYVSKQITQ